MGYIRCGKLLRGGVVVGEYHRRKTHLRPVFRRVLAHFERPVDFAVAVGESRAVVDYWINSLGFIPAQHALSAANAVGGKVPVIDIINEAHREKIARKAAREALKEREELAQIGGGQEAAGE